MSERPLQQKRLVIVVFHVDPGCVPLRQDSARQRAACDLVCASCVRRGSWVSER
ncbi:hypothetical protein GCK32_021833 [Trichostrongylus colubriformis]|uniref:Uncharacterized protein n=1 Tax=Trichostrongylus colubriformis TaxID=6319 RepID=A0AAN8F212_TRICO